MQVLSVSPHGIIHPPMDVCTPGQSAFGSLSLHAPRLVPLGPLLTGSLGALPWFSPDPRRFLETVLVSGLLPWR